MAVVAAAVALGAWWVWPSGAERRVRPAEQTAAPAGPVAASGTAPPATADDPGRRIAPPSAASNRSAARPVRGGGGGPASPRPAATFEPPDDPPDDPPAEPPTETVPTPTRQTPSHDAHRVTGPVETAGTPGVENDALAQRAAAVPPPAAAVTLPSTPPASPRVVARARTGLEMLDRNEPVSGRRLLTDALDQGGLDAATADQVRDRLAELNEDLVFGPAIVPGDPFVHAYEVQSGDALSKIPRKMGVHTDWRFIQRINRLARPEHIRVGQRLKLVTGPFHAVITKHAYRLDLYVDDGTDRAYVRSFRVGLGEYNSTPEGRFRVRPDSKLINPEWVNPRTRERFRPDDPANPIGEHWIGLVGDEPHLREVYGYGIHGTIEPDSIGRQASMGCVRMAAEDVALVWEVLVDDVSTIEIRP